ncbi:MAG: xanthine dehydrogenase accessory protein XdhC [Halothiobacillus sp.]
MMLNWPTLAQLNTQTEPFALVTVGAVKGSSPRETGTKMAVFPDRIIGTIGGGHLEFFAIGQARTLLASAPFHTLSQKSTPLTPRFDQCCGGVVQLVFEKIQPTHCPWLNQLAQFIDRSQSRSDVQSAWLFSDLTSNKRILLNATPTTTHQAQFETGTGLIEAVVPADMDIVIFGSGHVGRALVQSLQHLNANLSIIDSREDQLNFSCAPQIQKICTDDWQSVIDRVSNTTYYIVLTHSHQLDFDLIEAILSKDRFRYCGLIGSKTKKIRFERKLSTLGFHANQIAKITCPIGLPEIQGKSPEVIAASVCAQILTIQSRIAHNQIPHYSRKIHHE